MKTVVISVLTSLLLVFVAFVAVYNFVPLSAFTVLDLKRPLPLGSTITTILATDTLRDSRSTINTNFSNLNKDKLEQGTTTGSLFVGNLTIGTLFATTSGATATSTFAGPLGSRDYIAANYFVGTSTTATSTMANGIRLTGGCIFSVPLNDCLRNAISSIANNDGTLTISPTTGAVVASLNLASPNTWSATQSFTGGLRLATTSPAHASGTPLTLDTNGSIKYTFPNVAQGVASRAVGSTGNQTIVHGLGRIPYNIEISGVSEVSMVQDADTYNGIAHSFGHGTSTAGTTQSAVFSFYGFNSAAGSSIQIASSTQSHIIYFPDNGAGGDIEAAAQLTNMNATDFTLNWTVNDAASSGVSASDVRAFHWKVY